MLQDQDRRISVSSGLETQDGGLEDYKTGLTQNASFQSFERRCCQSVSWRGVVVSGVRRMNEVNARRARLVLLGWVTD